MPQFLYKRVPSVWVEWPFETTLAASMVSWVLISLGLYTYPIPLIYHTVGPQWAIAWTFLALVSAAIMWWGLARDDLLAVVCALRMGGTLMLGYLMLSIGTPTAGFPVISLGTLAVMGITALGRAWYLAHRITWRGWRR